MRPCTLTLGRTFSVQRERIAKLYAQPVHGLPCIEVVAGAQRRDALSPMAEQKVGRAAGNMEHQCFLTEQLRLTRGVQRRRNMPLLMCQLHKRQRAGKRKRRGGTDTGQKARHIRALDRAGLGGNTHGRYFSKVGVCGKLCQHGGQGCRVVEKGVTLAQAQLTLFHGQKLFAIANNLSGVCVKHCQRGCVIAGVNAQRQHLGSSVSPRSRATAPKRPLTNW